MARKTAFLGLILMLLLGSCKAPAYLPESEDIGTHAFGSYITIDLNEGKDLEGELISIDEEALLVLPKQGDLNIQSVPAENIKSFTLMYAQPKNYGWSIPVSVLITASHGVFAVFTAPINIVVTSVVTSRGQKAFTYRDQDISMEELKMFARFPQGLPPQIEVVDLK